MELRDFSYDAETDAEDANELQTIDSYTSEEINELPFGKTSYENCETFIFERRKKKKKQPKRSWAWHCVQLVSGNVHGCIKCLKQFNLDTVTISDVSSHVENHHPELFEKFKSVGEEIRQKLI